MSLDLIRFTTSEPGKLSQELDRFVLAVRREFDSRARAAQERFIPTPVTHGITGSTVTVAPKLGELVPVNPALGAVDVYLPRASSADAGRGVLVLLRSTAFAATLRPGLSTLNLGGAVALPAVIAAYLAVWDGAGWWTVNDAT